MPTPDPRPATAAKLGLWLKGSGRFPYLVPADVYRPAAVEQLQRVGQGAGLKVYAHDGSGAPFFRPIPPAMP